VVFKTKNCLPAYTKRCPANKMLHGIRVSPLAAAQIRKVLCCYCVPMFSSYVIPDQRVAVVDLLMLINESKIVLSIRQILFGRLKKTR
jgi:hypothetical protein